jgi:pilus assembly protein CpaE
MMRSAAKTIETAPLRACVVARDAGAFGQLAAELEVEMAGDWGFAGLDEGPGLLADPAAVEIELVVLAITADDASDLPLFAEIVRAAHELGHRLLLVTDGLSPMHLHELLAQGAGGFVPYPLPPGALAAAIARMTRDAAPPPHYDRRQGDPDHRGVVLPVQGLSGGAGATTFAVNLAWELATVDRAAPPRVCLLDFDLQFGACATHLDLPRREAVVELLTQTATMDREVFEQALLPYRDRLSVLTAPADLVPLDLITPDDAARLVAMARSSFDYVVIDMPAAFVMWTETVLQAAHLYFALIELDLRSAQNVLRVIRALKAEDLPADRLRFVLNRAPSWGGSSRIARMTESLDIALELRLPDGGHAVRDASDNGEPLAIGRKRNPLRREIARLAAQIHAVNREAERA